MKRATACLNSGSVRPPIRETLASSTLHGKRGTFAIVVAKLDAVIETEIVFGKVAVQNASLRSADSCLSYRV